MGIRWNSEENGGRREKGREGGREGGSALGSYLRLLLTYNPQGRTE